MKRYQTIRKPLVILTALLFHLLLVFHLLFSPVIVVAAAWKGIINASFVVYTLIFFTSLFFGRAFCSWFCPGCGIQEIISAAVRKKSRNSKANYLKYIIFTIWLGTIVTGYLITGIHTVDLTFGMTDLTLVRKIILTAGALLIILPVTFAFGRFASCKYVCWMAPFLILGTKIRDFFHLRGLRLNVSAEKCTGCGICTTACPMNLDVSAQVQMREMKHDECILCGNCLDSCKKGAIKFTFAK